MGSEDSHPPQRDLGSHRASLLPWSAGRGENELDRIVQAGRSWAMTVGENGDVVAAGEEMPVLLQDAAESWDLFGASKLGRLAANVGVQPEIFPINYPEHTDAAWRVIVKGPVGSRQRENENKGR